MILVPYAPGQLRKETVEALKLTGLPVEYRIVEGDEGYFWCLLGLWDKIDDDLVVIEQDIVPTPTSIQEMLDCPETWCSCWYRYRIPGRYDGPLHGLGHTKFSKKLQQECWHVPKDIAIKWDEKHPPRHWCTLDMQIYASLTCGSGVYSRHRHEHVTEVGHIGTHTHGCLHTLSKEGH